MLLSTNDVGSKHLFCGLPKITAFNHFAHIQNGEFKASQIKLKKEEGK